MKRISEETRVQQINALPNISFVRWADDYVNNKSKAICRCDIDGYEWRANAKSLIDLSTGCPQCAGRRRWTAKDRIEQLNELPNISFVRWPSEYLGASSKATVQCRIDGFEWSATINSLLKGHGCQQCANNRRWTAAERIAQINALQNITFKRWVCGYRNKNSQAVCQCSVDGCEWSSSVNNLINHRNGCPDCAKHGFNRAKPATLYILRSYCGGMVKIGISNDHKTRLAALKRVTPFDWSCVEMLHSQDGALIAELEKELHSRTEQAKFKEQFDGFTEWRKWDDRIPAWINLSKDRLER